MLVQSKQMADNLLFVKKVAAEVQKMGGRAYYVGGYVRDRILGYPNKDVDIEVHGISAEKLQTILSSFGEPMLIGNSFGIFGVKGYEVDISMPRLETATGRGHKDFAVSVDPFLGEEKAARRRDFTINALMEDVLTGKILDFYGGLSDIRNQRIRHVDSTTFVEDPLRVLRAAQFAARFGYIIDPKTRQLASCMDILELPRERIMMETSKALLRAQTPSVFFRELRKMGHLSVWFPELDALIGVPQAPEHHPEGDVWEHTMQVLDEAARLREQASYPLGFMFAALCHDFGKSAVTEELFGRVHSYGHEAAGIPLADRFLQRLTDEKRLLAYTRNMVEHHMAPNSLVDNRAGTKAFMKLFDKAIDKGDLLLLAKADRMGRATFASDRQQMTEAYAATEAKLKEMLLVYQERMRQPHVRGADLVSAGLQPGPHFSTAMKYAHNLRLAGVPLKQQIPQVIAYAKQIQEQTGTTHSLSR